MKRVSQKSKSGVVSFWKVSPFFPCHPLDLVAAPRKGRLVKSPFIADTSWLTAEGNKTKKSAPRERSCCTDSRARSHQQQPITFYEAFKNIPHMITLSATRFPWCITHLATLSGAILQRGLLVVGKRGFHRLNISTQRHFSFHLYESKIM